MVMTVVILFGVIFSTTGALQDMTNQETKTEFLFSLLQKANMTVVEIFQRLEAKSLSVPKTSLEKYENALSLANQAELLLRGDKYVEAGNLIILSLQELKEALRLIYDVVVETPTEIEINLEKTIRLNSAIERYSQQIQSIENMTRFATQKGYNTTEIQLKIQTAKRLLSNASREIGQRNFEAASNSFSQAQIIIENLRSDLERFAAILKVQRLTTYIVETEKRLATIREKAISLSSTLPTSTISASISALDSAQLSLNSAKTYLENQMVDKSLSELAISKESEEKAIEILKPALSASSLTASSLTTGAIQDVARLP